LRTCPKCKKSIDAEWLSIGTNGKKWLKLKNNEWHNCDGEIEPIPPTPTGPGIFCNRCPKGDNVVYTDFDVHNAIVHSMDADFSGLELRYT
jgi:hypothetical protein